jgi:hypothetical protein
MVETLLMWVLGLPHALRVHWRVSKLQWRYDVRMRVLERIRPQEIANILGRVWN